MAAVDFESLYDAFLFVSAGQPMENEGYLRREDCKIYLRSDYVDDEEPLPEDLAEDEKYLAIPHKNDFDLGKPLALKFAAQSLPNELLTVNAMFSARGAYARFKDLLERNDLLKQWHEFEEQAGRNALREWCSENGIALAD
ncbi:MAG: hypothetical protein JOY51_06605 [Nevskia sp.]|nr:hypothetical protein [Nevskia sp.]